MRVVSCAVVVALCGLAGADPAGKAAPTCVSVLSCYSKCTDMKCVAACDVDVDPAITVLSRAFSTCSLDNKCRDGECQKQHCSKQLATCIGNAPAATQPAAPAATCVSVVTCYSKCTKPECITACDAGIDSTITQRSQAFSVCSLQHKCTDSACQQKQCGAQLSACLGTAKVAATPSTPAAPAAASKPSHVTALWMGMRIGNFTAYSSPGIQWYVFFDDGGVFFNLPSEGLEGIDENDLRKLSVGFGTYTKTHDRVEMTFDKYHALFSLSDDNNWTGRSGTFWEISGHDGLVLDGAYAPKSGPPVITFKRDGTFQTTGVLVGLTLKSTGPGSGTYRIAHNTITLTFTTGKVFHTSFTTLQGKVEGATAIYITGFEYHRP